MQTYSAPLRDMRFVLHELHDSVCLAQLPGLEQITPDLLDSVLEEAAKFTAGVLLPLNASGDFGLVALGCMWVQMAKVVADKRIVPEDSGFYRSKCQTATFFIEHLLPPAFALLPVIKAGKASMMALEDNAF